MYAHTCTCTHMCTYTHAYTCTHVCTHMHAHTCTHKCMHAFTHTYTQVYACTHTHISHIHVKLGPWHGGSYGVWGGCWGFSRAGTQPSPFPQAPRVFSPKTRVLVSPRALLVGVVLFPCRSGHRCSACTQECGLCPASPWAEAQPREAPCWGSEGVGGV